MMVFHFIIFPFLFILRYFPDIFFSSLSSHYLSIQLYIISSHIFLNYLSYLPFDVSDRNHTATFWYQRIYVFTFYLYVRLNNVLARNLLLVHRNDFNQLFFSHSTGQSTLIYFFQMFVIFLRFLNSNLRDFSVN